MRNQIAWQINRCLKVWNQKTLGAAMEKISAMRLFSGQARPVA
jgi:hypothetical protein